MVESKKTESSKAEGAQVDPSVTQSAGFTQYPLNEKIQQALVELKFSQATEVQQRTLEPALAGSDLMISAATGSGKTIAFLMPLLQQMLSKDNKQTATRALVVVPTRELARQIHKHFKDLAKFTHIKAGVITGGEEFKYQKALLRKNPEVIIATPGRVLEHLEKGSADFSDLEVLVIDEADRMLDMGFGDDVMAITEACGQQRQTLLLSATLKHGTMQAIAAKVLRQPQIVAVGKVRQKHEHITQQRLLADDVEHKKKLLGRLLEKEDVNKALVFCNTKVQVSQLLGSLRYHGFSCAELHGDITQDQRRHTINAFRQGRYQVLAASDVAARGIDVEGIELVVNFDVPRSGDDYIHRIGRTGRAGAEGLAVTMITHREWNLMSSIERYLDFRLEPRVIPGLEGSYKGPKKVKASGKSAKTKKKPVDKKAKKAKTKARMKDKKNAGKRRNPTANVSQDGLAPMQRNKNAGFEE